MERAQREILFERPRERVYFPASELTKALLRQLSESVLDLFGHQKNRTSMKLEIRNWKLETGNLQISQS